MNAIKKLVRILHTYEWGEYTLLEQLQLRDAAAAELDRLEKRIAELEDLLRMAQACNTNGCGWVLHGMFYDEIEAALKAGAK